MGAGAVAQHYCDAFAEVSVGSGGPMAPKCDGVAAEGLQGSGDHPDVEPPALASRQDLGRNEVAGFPQAGAECRGSKSHGRTDSSCGQSVGERPARQTRPLRVRIKRRIDGRQRPGWQTPRTAGGRDRRQRPAYHSGGHRTTIGPRKAAATTRQMAFSSPGVGITGSVDR